MKRLMLILTMVAGFVMNSQAQNNNQSTYSPSKSALEGMLGMVQTLNIRGTVYDSQSLQTLPGAQIKLAKEDGTLVAGAATNDKGQYLLQKIPTGTYRLNISYIGYKAQNFTITLPKKSGNFKVSDVLLKENATMMQETVIEGKMAEMTVVDDTVMYNADAFKLPDGAVVEELIKKLPGITIDDDGNYIFNGKKVSQFLVDGKEFFGGNRDLILKNLPAEIVDKVKAYDKKSDRARITGIDDGDEETVLDLIIKQGMKKGWFGNFEGGYGVPSDRYQGRLNVNYFKGDNKFGLVGNGNNTGGNGMNDQQSAGLTLNIQKTKLDQNGSVTGNFSQSRSQSWSNSQNFELSSPKYNNSHSWSGNNNNSLNMRYKLEWRPDSSWNFLFQPDVQWSKGSSHNDSESAQFNENPYDYSDDPLADWRKLEDDYNIGINHRRSTSRNENDRFNVNASLQINKRLGKPGRNITLNLSGGYGNQGTESTNYSQTDYLQSIRNQMIVDGQTVYIDVEDSVYHKVQFNNNPSINYNYTAQLGYSEPIADQTYLQLNYRFNYRYQDNKRNIRAIYDNFFDDFGNFVQPPFGNLPGMINVDNYRDFYDSNYVKDDTLQLGYTTNSYINQELRAQIRLNRTKYELTVGGNVQPQYNKVDNVRGKDGSQMNLHTSRTVWNASPNVNFRYKFSRQETFNFRYSGSTGQPNITDMVDGVLSDNDPLNIRLGNPNLKPSFSHNINADYRTTNIESQRTHSINGQFRLTQNSTTQKTEYNEETGGRVSQPVNVNGNWSGSLSYNFNTALGEAKHWRISNDMSGNFNNNIGYQYNAKEKETIKTRTNTYRLQDRIRLTYRHDWESGWQLETTAGANANYNINRSTNPNANNLNIWTFGGNFNTHLTFPWNMQFNTDISTTARRGYADKSANTTRTIWNASISQRLLPKRILTLTLKWVDILSQRDDLNRNVSALSVSDSHSEMVSSYVLFTANLRFGLFGSRSGRSSRNRGGDDTPKVEIVPDGGGRSAGNAGGGAPTGGRGGNGGGGNRGGGGRM